MSVEILSTVETSCTTNAQQIAVMEWLQQIELCSKQPRLGDCRIGVVNKLDRRQRRQRILLTTRDGLAVAKFSKSGFGTKTQTEVP